MFHIPLVLLGLLTITTAHLRLSYPPPRSNQNAPSTVGAACGTDTGVWTGTVTTISPGPLEIIIQEQAHHATNPYRLALSRENSDVYDCILLGHIPQHTYTGAAELHVTVQIPDVKCDNCAIQMLNFERGGCCLYADDSTNGNCASMYHSCANVKITGSGSRSDLTCLPTKNWQYAYWAPNHYTSMNAQTTDWIELTGHTAASPKLRLNINTDYVLPAQCQNYSGPFAEDVSSSTNGGSSSAAIFGSFSDDPALQGDTFVAVVITALGLIAILLICFIVKHRAECAKSGVSADKRETFQPSQTQARPPPPPPMIVRHTQQNIQTV